MQLMVPLRVQLETAFCSLSYFRLKSNKTGLKLGPKLGRLKSDGTGTGEAITGTIEVDFVWKDPIAPFLFLFLYLFLSTARYQLSYRSILRVS